MGRGGRQKEVHAGRRRGSSPSEEEIRAGEGGQSRSEGKKEIFAI